MASIVNDNYQLTGWGSAFATTGRFPLQANTVFNNYSDILTFATTNGTAYAGAIVSALNDYTIGDEVYPKGAYYIASWGEGAEVLLVGKESDLSDYYTKTQVDKTLESYYTKTQVDGIITSVYKYQGSLSSLPNIDDNGAVTGDADWDSYENGFVYNITTTQTLKPYDYTNKRYYDSAIIYPAGTNFAFVDANATDNTPEHWDALGGVMDLSGYMKTPIGGTAGQILTKTNDGYGWEDAPQTAQVSESNNIATITAGGTTTVYNTTAIDNWLSWNEIS